jgi:hypothetical protein
MLARAAAGNSHPSLYKSRSVCIRINRPYAIDTALVLLISFGSSTR